MAIEFQSPTHFLKPLYSRQVSNYVSATKAKAVNSENQQID